MAKTITLEPDYIAIAKMFARKNGDSLNKNLTKQQAIAYINKILDKIEAS